MAVAWSSNERTVIERSLDIHPADCDIGDISQVFEVDRCVHWIQEHKLANVTLQFPDVLLPHAPKVALMIEEKVGHRVSILGDTSYGECCVDEVAADHIGADGIVHFGHTCLTPTHVLPVLFVYTVLPLDTDDLQAKLLTQFTSKVALFYDVQYHHAFQHCNCPDNVSVCLPSEKNESLVRCGRQCPQHLLDHPDDWNVVYVGRNESYTLLLALTFNKARHYMYSPNDKTLHENGLNIGKMLMKRYYMVEKAKDAERIGILVGTLGASRYTAIMDQAKKAIRASGKRVYTFLVGKPNVPKLANFPEVDIYVLVACPENSLLDSKDYYRPIITPFELDLALNKSRQWTGDFYADFRDLLPGQSHYEAFECNADETDISLISGKIRTLATLSDPSSDVGMALAVQQTQVSLVHSGGGGQFLAERSWKGLEQNLGETPAVKAVEGQSGIASSYSSEPK